MTAPYTIRPARAADIGRLNTIEQAADRTAYTGILEHADALPLDPAAALDVARRAGHLWVATNSDDQPVGYCYVRFLGGEPHVEEVSVHPDHGRQGLGRALVEAALGWARAAGHERLTLNTFRELRWCAPFYASLGFTEVPRDAASPEIQALLAEEESELLPLPDYPGKLTRITMACRFDRPE